MDLISSYRIRIHKIEIGSMKDNSSVVIGGLDKKKIKADQEKTKIKRKLESNEVQLQSSLGPRDATVTIVMPTYNRAKQLPRAVKSVLNQTFKNWHLLIVDDGSTDSTIKIYQ